MQIITNLINTIKKAIKQGAFDIIVSGLINKALMFVTNVLIIRLMDKYEYGVFSYVYNIICILMIFSSLGLDVTLMQFCCEERDKDEKLQIAKFLFFAGLICNLLFSITTFSCSFFINFEFSEAAFILRLFSFILPFVYVLNYQKNILRIERRNKTYSLLTNISSIAYLILSVVLIKSFGIIGAIFGRYAAFIFPIIIGTFFIVSSLKEIFKSGSIKKNLIFALLKYGLTIALTNGVSELLYYLDIYVIGQITTDAEAIANYKSATLIPRAITSLPAILMIFLYPYFAKNKNNKTWIFNNTMKLEAFMLFGSSILAIVLMFIAPWLIKLLYGIEYLDSVPHFRILTVSFVFSVSFRAISGNILAMIGKVKVNFVLGCIECVINIALDFLLVYLYGSIGAALATLFITIISSAMSNIYLIFYLKRKK